MASTLPRTSRYSSDTKEAPSDGSLDETIHVSSGGRFESEDAYGEILFKDARRRRVYAFVQSRWFQVMASVVILFNFTLICREADILASGEHVPGWIQASMAACFALYCIEFVAISYALRLMVFQDLWHVLDLVIVVIGIIDYSLEAADLGVQYSNLLHITRLCRLLRLAKAMRMLGFIPELSKLMLLFASGFRTLFWSFFLCLLVMTVWSIVAVETVNELARELAAKEIPEWAGCDRCGRAFGSVMDANLTFLQTVVAGDMWGRIAIPIIEASPLSALIFVGSLLTLVYGVLNLIVAVIVDVFADIRSRDISTIAREMKEGEVAERRLLTKIFRQIDREKCGRIALSDILQAAKTLSQFRNYLQILNVSDKSALKGMFMEMDRDDDGYIPEAQFVEAILRHSQHTPPVFQRAHSTPANRVTTTFMPLPSLQEKLERVESAVLVKMSDLESKIDATGFSRTCSPAEGGASVNEPALIHLDQGERDTIAENTIAENLRKHEEDLTNIIESSMAQAASVAIEAAMSTAMESAIAKAKEVMTGAAMMTAKASELTSARLDWARRVSESPFGSQVGKSASGQSGCTPYQTTDTREEKLRTPDPLTARASSLHGSHHGSHHGLQPRQQHATDSTDSKAYLELQERVRRKARQNAGKDRHERKESKTTQGGLRIAASPHQPARGELLEASPPRAAAAAVPRGESPQPGQQCCSEPLEEKLRPPQRSTTPRSSSDCSNVSPGLRSL